MYRVEVVGHGAALFEIIENVITAGGQKEIHLRDGTPMSDDVMMVDIRDIHELSIFEMDLDEEWMQSQYESKILFKSLKVGWRSEENRAQMEWVVKVLD